MGTKYKKTIKVSKITDKSMRLLSTILTIFLAIFNQCIRKVNKKNSPITEAIANFLGNKTGDL